MTMHWRLVRNGFLRITILAATALAGTAEARHWQWAFESDGHAMPIGSFHEPSAECEAECVPLANDPAQRGAFDACIARHRCQPLILPPPSPDPAACAAEDTIQDSAQFETECRPFAEKMLALAQSAPDSDTAATAVFSRGSCCLQFGLAEEGWRGYQLEFGSYEMLKGPTINDEFTIGWARVPNAQPLDAEESPYEYMVAFEFWQHSGSHHFIMDDLLGPYNDPDSPRDCEPNPDAPNGSCEKFAALPESCPARTDEEGKGPRTNGGSACSFGGGGMQSFPLAGSPGPSYFPVPYPDGVGIKISREHIFRMTHHIQDWFNPQLAQVWINIYTVPAKRSDGSESVEKEAHVFFDGSASAFLIPPRTIAAAQGVWVAPRNIELYGLTAHSHKRNVLFTADLIGVDGEVKSLPIREYQYSHPYCGGYARIPSQPGVPPGPDDPVDRNNPPLHLYESTDWAEHEQCPYWREDGNNDPSGAILIRQGEGIRYNCLVNNGILPSQTLTHPALQEGTGDPALDSTLQNLRAGIANNLSRFPPQTLAVQSVPVEPRDAFGRVVRLKYSCEEIPGVVPGFPGAGALGYYHNRPCIPDALKPLEPHEDYHDPETAQVALEGGPAVECDPNDGWTQFRQDWFSGNYTGKCVPASIGFAETEDDEMCILLGLYAFTDDDLVPIGRNGPLGEYGIDRLPTDVGR
jgi:hypothetical protein